MLSPRRILTITLLTAGLMTAIGVSFHANYGSTIKTPRKPIKLHSLEADIRAEIIRGEAADIKKIKSDIAQLLQTDPLNDNALVYHGNSLVSQSGWEAFDSPVFEVVKLRNPRNRKNLQALLVQAFAQNNYYAAFEVINLQYTLNWNQREEVLNLLDIMYNSESGSLVFNEQLIYRPSWEADFLYAQSKKITPETLEYFPQTMAQAVALSEDIRKINAPLNRLLHRLILAGQIDQAIELWKSTKAKVEEQNLSLGTEAIKTGAVETINYNPNFLDTAAPAPFNWTFYPNENVVTEKTPEGHRYVSFSGEKQRLVARQYFIPPTGGLSVSVKAEYYYKYKQGNFALSLNCIAPAAQNFEFDLNEASSNQAALKKEFDGFGPDCRLASLSIVAKPGIFNERISMTVNSIAVTATP